MHKATYTRFFVLVVAALAIGFVGMEAVTTSVGVGSLTGMAVTVADAGPGLTATASPGSNLLFLFIGLVGGAVIVGTAVYLYSVERNRID